MQKFAACCWSRNSQQNSIVDSKIELQSLYMQLRSITVCIISHAFARPTPFKVNTLILPFKSSLCSSSRSWFITTHEMMPEWYCVKKYNFGIPSMQRPSKSVQKLNSLFQTLLDLRVWFDAGVASWNGDWTNFACWLCLKSQRGAAAGKLQQKLDSCIFAASKCVLKNTFYEFQISKLHDNRDNLWPKQIWIRRKIFRFHPPATQDGKRLETQ